MTCSKFFCLLSFWVVLWGCVPISGPTDTETKTAQFHYQMGVNYLGEGKTTQAIKELDEAVKISPGNADYQHGLGLAYQQKGLYDDAITKYKKALELDPKLTEARNNWGTVLLATGKNDEAIATFEQCLKDKVYATPEKAAYNIGVAYFNKKDLDKAMEYYQKAINLKEDNAVAMYNLAFCLEEKKNVPKAAQWYKKAATSDPTFKEANYRLGVILTDQQDYKGALEALKKAVDIDPKYISAQYQMGIVLLKLGQEAEGRKSLEMVMNEEPEGELGKKAREELDFLAPKGVPKPATKPGRR
jgi:type IV pilus biogenesis/stability protein PilW